MAQQKTYQTAKAFREALESRLKTIALAEGKALQRLRRQVAFDRLLARLFHRSPSPFALKGGYALELRIQTARATKDIDLTLRSTEILKEKKELGEFFRDLLIRDASIELNDHFSFLVGGQMLDLEAVPYGGARFPVESRIDERSFVKFHVDVAAGDYPIEPLETLTSRDWLEFAQIPSKDVVTIPKEQQFAEKLHAYTRPRTVANSRARDLIDIILLIDNQKLDTVRVIDALKKTFKRRKSHSLPKTLEPPPADWTERFDTMAKECNLPHDIGWAFKILQSYFAVINGGK